MLPLLNRLKKQGHRDIAKAQDLIVEALYTIFNSAVMHGGTAIWRCYQGNRFSEDIDVYLPKNEEQLNRFFEKLQQRGFRVEKKKIGAHSLYSQLTLNRTSVRLEALWKKVEGILKEYETVEGNSISIYTLSSEQLIQEKVSAYLNRRKIRDLYDIFILLREVREPQKIEKELQQLVTNFEKPVDESELKVLVLEGLVPTTEKMLEYIKNWR